MGHYRYYGNHRYTPLEELGRPITKDVFIASLLKHGAHPNKAIGMTDSCFSSIQKFVNEDSRDLSTEVIISILLDCIKFEFPMSNKEKEEKRKFLKRHDKSFNDFLNNKHEEGIFFCPINSDDADYIRDHEPLRTEQRYVDCKARNELIHFLMYFTYKKYSSQKIISKEKAILTVAKWLILLNTKIGGDSVEQMKKYNDGNSKIHRDIDIKLLDEYPNNPELSFKLIQVFDTLRKSYDKWFKTQADPTNPQFY